VKKTVGFLLAIAGCGGLLFDFGGTIINPAIPYFESLKLFTTAQMSHLTSAVVMSAALAGLVAGLCAEKFGRKTTMLIAAALAAVACLPICLADGAYWPFYAGRALQGFAAGLIGVVVPMYLAEVLPASSRGKGAGIFQFMDVVGILFCSLVGLAVVHIVGAADDPAVSAATKHVAWKTIFWSSAVPAVAFFVGALFLDESPVWLERRLGKAAKAETGDTPAVKDSVFQRKYILPFLLAVLILACNQATGCNSVQYFALKMFQDAGLSNSVASVANVSLWLAMLAATMAGTALVDRAGRKFILKIGTVGLVLADILAGTVFLLVDKGVLRPGALSGWAMVLAMVVYICAFSIGPGVVVWLALSELMPDRIRANGMAVGLFINMMVAYVISDVFLQWVEKSGYSSVFYTLAGFGVVYFLAAAFLLPETKGKTLKEIEEYFK
jgi:MFS family permease